MNKEDRYRSVMERYTIVRVSLDSKEEDLKSFIGEVDEFFKMMKNSKVSHFITIDTNKGQLKIEWSNACPNERAINVFVKGNIRNLVHKYGLISIKN